MDKRTEKTRVARTFTVSNLDETATEWSGRVTKNELRINSEKLVNFNTVREDGKSEMVSRAVTASSVTDHLLLDDFAECHIEPLSKAEICGSYAKDVKAGIGEDDYLKLAVSKALYLGVLRDYYENSVVYMYARDLVAKAINRDGILNFASLVYQSRECIFENREPLSSIDFLVCQLYEIDPIGAIVFTTVGSRECFSTYKLEGGAEKFIKRNELAGQVATRLEKAENLAAFLKGSVGNVLCNMFTGWDPESMKDDRDFMNSIPKGTPLEGAKTLNQKVQMVALEEYVTNRPLYFDSNGVLNNDAFYVEYSEVPKNFEKKRGITQFPNSVNAYVRAFVDSVKDVVRNNTFGSLDIEGQDRSVSIIVNEDLEGFVTLDFSNCTDSTNRFHQQLFPSVVSGIFSRGVPSAVVVDGKVYPNHILFYMGWAGTTFLNSCLTWAIAYVAGVICESSVNIPIWRNAGSDDEGNVLLGISRFNEELTSHWKTCNFALVPHVCERITVWNDDVIIPSKWAGVAMDLYRAAGFQLNATKSFTRTNGQDGTIIPDVVVNDRRYRVRESCGAFAVKDLDSGKEFRTEHIPTLTRKDLSQDPAGIVRLFANAREFYDANCYHCAMALSGLGMRLIGNGYTDGFATFDFRNAPDTKELAPLTVGMDEILPGGTISSVITAEYILGKNHKNKVSEANFQTYKWQYYVSLAGKDVAANFGIPVLDEDGKVVDFAEYYGIRDGVMTYNQFIKTEDDVCLVKHDITHYAEVAWAKLCNTKKEFYVLMSRRTALKSARNLVRMAQHIGGKYVFDDVRAAVKFLQESDKTFWRHLTRSECIVALHLLNPKVGLLEVGYETRTIISNDSKASTKEAELALSKIKEYFASTSKSE